jgi:hypothetical protein
MGGVAGTHEIARPIAQRAASLAEHPATEEQINMRAALAQRIDKQGTKIEESAAAASPIHKESSHEWRRPSACWRAVCSSLA